MSSSNHSPGTTGVYKRIKEARDYLKTLSSETPKVAIVLGSGLGGVAKESKNSVSVPYESIPWFHGTTVEGHVGELTMGVFQGVQTVFLNGRFHYYEGYPMEDVVLPTRVVAALGVRTIVLTNAAGGINTRFRPTDLMIIEDHLNLMGDNPLKGPNLADLGPRFPDLSEPYGKRLIKILEETAKDLGFSPHKGVYGGLLGPTYETPAEVRMLRTLGADAVGMSTVPEAIAANHLGVEVCGVSCITNLAAGMSAEKLSHQEVIDNSRIATDRLAALLRAAVGKM